jgi:hypothetical protein
MHFLIVEQSRGTDKMPGGEYNQHDRDHDGASPS